MRPAIKNKPFLILSGLFALTLLFVSVSQLVELANTANTPSKRPTLSAEEVYKSEAQAALTKSLTAMNTTGLAEIQDHGDGAQVTLLHDPQATGVKSVYYVVDSSRTPGNPTITVAAIEDDATTFSLLKLATTLQKPSTKVIRDAAGAYMVEPAGNDFKAWFAIDDATRTIRRMGLNNWGSDLRYTLTAKERNIVHNLHT
jgi:hypothetical protein